MHVYIKNEKNAVFAHNASLTMGKSPAFDFEAASLLETAITFIDHLLR